jgi:enoyl-CoA hydratase
MKSVILMKRNFTSDNAKADGGKIMSESHLVVERKGPIEVLKINRPQVLNALNFALLEELYDRLKIIAKDQSIRAIIMTGEGEKAFCAGADIQELRGRHIWEERQGMLLGQATFTLLENLGKPSIAAINGYALGGGLELALSCTFRIAASNARLGFPEINLGLIPGYGGTQRLPRLVGCAKAAEMILLGLQVTAEEAQQLGLVTKVVEPTRLMEESFSLASRICEKSPLAIALAMESIRRGMDTCLLDGLKIEADLGTIAYNTEDAREGLAAFLEKRKPVFRGR